MSAGDSNKDNATALPANAIAVIGMAGRFPGADTIEALWAALREGRDLISRFTDEELEDSFTAQERAEPNFVKARPVLNDVDKFDAAFFNMYPREAALLDPQHRLMLEVAYEAFEDAGVDPYAYEGAVGVFASNTLNTYLIHHVLGDRETAENFTSTAQLGDYARFAGAMGDTMATRIAYKLNLRGPAMSVQSCCSSSLLAIAQACQSLILYQSDMALAGGVSITFPQKRGYHFLEGGMASQDGYCRPFDADAVGTIFGHGAGAVLLKRLEDAVADGDRIYAVIRSSAVNNDGADKVGYTAPSVDGQAAVIMTAHMTAGIDPRSIGYIEAHGTATPMGDPIEIAGLTKAFEAVTSERQFCAIGSGKGNLGHLDAAAGVVGFIKAAISVHRNEITPLAHFKAPNPRIDFAQTPFFVADKLQAFPPNEGPRRAGVSSFGVGGTNVHILLEQAPPQAARTNADMRRVEILPISAKCEASVNAMKAALADQLEANPPLSLSDVAFTLQAHRHGFERRTTIAARDRADAIAKLRAPGAVQKAAESAPPVIFMFPGQGAQYPGMGAGLYENEPLFRSIVDRGAEFLKPLLGLDLRDPLFNQPDAGEDTRHPIRSTILAQPALFVVEYATARLLMSWGVRPAAMVGHSVGEFVAACIAGVVSFEDALRLIAARGRLMQAQEPGAMLSIRLPEAEARQHLGEDIDLAAINGPGLVVAAGPFAAIEALEARLTEKNIVHRRLHTSHAFHSHMMDGALAPLLGEAEKMSFSAPKIPYASGLTGAWATEAEACDPSAWARHCRETVRFADALATACEGKKPILIEVGAGKTLSMLAAQIVAKDKLAGIVNTLPDVSREPEDSVVIADAIGRVWALGGAPSFDALRSPDAARVDLPTYRFDRQRHWIDAPARKVTAQAEALPPSAAALFAAPMQMPIFAAPAAAIVPVFPEQEVPMSSQMSPEAHKAALADQLVKVLEDLSGEQIAGEDPNTTFLELGFDSLFLGQVAQSIQSKFGVKLTFRQLLGDYPSVEAVSAHLAQNVPIPAAAPVAAPAPTAAPAMAPMPMAAMPMQAMPGDANMAAMFQMQLMAMQNVIAQQFQMMQGGGAMPAAPAPQMAAPQAAPVASAAAPVAAKPAAEDEDTTPARFKMYRPGAGAQQRSELTNAQRALVEDMIALLEKRMPTSKALTQANRPALADPRTAAGFRLDWKDAVYPIVSERSKGSRIWDIDGNEYVDVVNGYGGVAFGHAPDFVVKAVEEQLHKGFAIGPQSPMAGEVANMLTEMLGMDRVTFCNTGSEAVMAAMRLTRAVSGKKKIVVFNNDYHGQFDEVLLRPAPKSKPPGAAPVAPGITPENVANMVVLGYDDPKSLDWIKANAGELAAVMVEPVQSRHPELQPVEFVRELRKITEEAGVALIFDEVVTGFRAHPGGMQAVWNIRADLATYGKVVGGGMPIGLLAGSSKYMDALDGGQWRYGDESMPEVAPTFFAGTFVRHPLVLAAAKATMLHMIEHGPALQEGVAAKVKTLAERLNADFARRGLSTRANQFSSFFYVAFANEDRLGSLFYPLARSKGLSIQEGFSCFFTTQHSDADMEFIFRVFSECLDDLQSVGILAGNSAPAPETKPLAAAVQAPAPAALTRAIGPAEAPLTEPQTEVWLAAQLGDAASASFNEGMTLRLEGPLNVDALTRAVNDVVARHDALRARFSASGEKMLIAPELPVDLHIFDASGEADPEAALADLQHADAAMPFDLVNGPLFRAFLVKLGAERHALVFTAHHIVCDGWSVNVVLEEMSAIYAARAQDASPDMKQPLSYAQYATDYAKRSGDRAAAEAFWMAKFKDGIPDLPELPYDRQRPAMKTFAGATLSRHIDAATYKNVKKAGAKQGCTLFATLFASMQVLIGRLSGQSDIVLAVPTAGQSLLDDEILVGHCVNFLPFRTAFDPAAPFTAHLANVKRDVLDAFEHQDYTFGTLVRKLEVKRDLNRLPMTEIQFNLERIGAKMALPGLKASAGPNAKAFSNFDMFWNIIESDDGLRIDVDYNTDILDRATIARWIDHFHALLTAIAADASIPVQALPLLSTADTTWMRETLNATSAAYPREAFVHELVTAQALKSPHKVAVSDGKSEITYGILEARSNALARRLQEIAPNAGSRIAIATDRSVGMVVSLLAAMKAGHAYVPLDPQHPASRLQQIIEGAHISALICDDAESQALAPAGVATLRIDTIADPANDDIVEPMPRLSGADRAAYVIFTSGSTGAPKGVEVPHRAFVNFLASMAKAPGFSANDSLLSVTTISFDIAGLELFLPLISGGRVSIASRDEVRGGFGLVERIAREKPSVVQATPSLWRMMLEAGFKPNPSLKMLCGGEPLPRDLADLLLDGGGQLWNMYGPTETTIWSSCGLVRKGAPIVIGEPIDNTQLHILDAGDQIAPIGVTGDLYIGGDGLANGYFNQPELTQKVFRSISLDGGPAQRLYKTGDVGRRLADGSIQLLGRTDQQIKLRGFRIELEDIESALRRAPGVAACATAVREINGDKRLVGYIVPAQGMALQLNEISAFLGANLPDYMVPAMWVTLEALPLTPNKKLDRKALPTPDPVNAAVSNRTITPPRTPVEQALAEIWSSVLSVKEIGVHDNLFTLGADSLHVFRIAARTMDRGIKLEAKHMLQKPTIAELAELIAAQERGDVATTPAAPSLRDFRGGVRRRQTS